MLSEAKKEYLGELKCTKESGMNAMFLRVKAPDLTDRSQKWPGGGWWGLMGLVGCWREDETTGPYLDMQGPHASVMSLPH